MKNLKLLCLLLAALTMLLLGGCGEAKTLTCDGCGTQVQVPADSNMDDSWVILCAECEKDVTLP